MRRGTLLMTMLLVSGCALAKTSSLLLERRVRGSLTEETRVGHPLAGHLEPVMQTKTQQGIEVNVNYASQEYLKNFFSNRALFGNFAGTNPFFPEQTVFYVKVANHSEKRIYLNPAVCVMTDDQGNQYHVLGQDYITAFAESRQPVATIARGVLEEARPGYFGLSLPVGKILAAKPQGQFALLQQSSLQPGYLYPDVVYDGLIAFWTPTPHATTLRLYITNLKTDFSANDEPTSALNFTFEFHASSH